MTVEQKGTVISRSDMTSVMENAELTEISEIGADTDTDTDTDTGDIPISEITGDDFGESVGFNQTNTFPAVLPNSPVFSVPSNPLLPEEYSEVLDYNSIQYMNGIFRTQIGRYVRVQQLVGSNMIDDHDGFLIGVGINYIILQDYSGGNIRILDIYGIKNMYVYYADIENPYAVSGE